MPPLKGAVSESEFFCPAINIYCRARGAADFQMREENMSRYLPVLLITLIFLCGHLASAQVSTATIAGVAQDASGAVIPGVSITAKNVETGVTRTATTDEGGRYTIPELTLGDYQVEAQLPGFRTEARSGITLTEGRSPGVNFRPKVGKRSTKGRVPKKGPWGESTTGARRCLW